MQHVWPLAVLAKPRAAARSKELFLQEGGPTAPASLCHPGLGLLRASCSVLAEQGLSGAL